MVPQKVFKPLIKLFEAPKRSVKIKKNFSSFGIGTGRVNAYAMNIFVVYVCCKNNIPCIVDLTGRRTSEF